MIDRLPVTDQDLSDLIDGRLGPGREQEVRQALDQRPDLARVYARMIEQDQMLRRLGEEVLAEPVPVSMMAVLRRAEAYEDRQPAPERPLALGRRFEFARRPVVLGSSLALAAGLVLGWFGHGTFGPSDAGLFQDAVRQAAIAHRAFEISGQPEPLTGLADSDVLPVADLPRLFGTPVRAPALNGSEWQPVGLKTEAGSGGSALQIAYADPQGETVTLSIRRLSDADDVPVSLLEAEGYDVLYWIDGPLIYALVGDQEEGVLLDLARKIYASRASGGDWSTQARPAAARPTVDVEP